MRCLGKCNHTKAISSACFVVVLAATTSTKGSNRFYHSLLRNHFTFYSKIVSSLGSTGILRMYDEKFSYAVDTDIGHETLWYFFTGV